MSMFRIKGSRSRSPGRSSDGTVTLDAASLIAAVAPAVPAAASANVAREREGTIIVDEKHTTTGTGAVQVVEFSFPSLLSPPNPAFSNSEARGILINARRPTSRERTDSALSSSLDPRGDQQPVLADKTNSQGTAGSSLSKASNSTSGKGSALSQSRPALRTSVSADSVTLSRSNTPEQSALPRHVSAGASQRIRFAPLPDPRRPRRYSTGRNIWVDDDPDNVHINARDGPEVDREGWNAASGGVPPLSIPGSAHSSDGHGEGGSPVSPFGSSYGSSSHNNHKRTTSTSSSITSKLLNPLKLGSRSKNKDKDLNRTSSIESTASNSMISPSSASYASVSQWLTGGEPLGRRISTGAIGDMPASDRERQRAEAASGAPLSKSLSTDTADMAATRPRKAYPSVAQGGRGRRAPQRSAKKVEEPEFVEWSHSSGLGGPAEEDDGSGMAWLKRRKEERARKAREEAEAAAANDSAAQQSALTGQDGSSRKNVQQPSGIPALQVEPSTPVNARQSEDRSEDDDLQLEEEEQEEEKEGEQRVQTPEESSPLMQTGALGSPKKHTSAAASTTDAEDDDDESSADEDEAGERSDDDDDAEDLTAEELEEEERLAEEARRTTEGAGREVFHSHEHVAATYRVDTSSIHHKKGTSDGTATATGSTEVSRRSSPLPSRNPSRQASLATAPTTITGA